MIGYQKNTSAGKCRTSGPEECYCYAAGGYLREFKRDNEKWLASCSYPCRDLCIGDDEPRMPSQAVRVSLALMTVEALSTLESKNYHYGPRNQICPNKILRHGGSLHYIVSSAICLLFTRPLHTLFRKSSSLSPTSCSYALTSHFKLPTECFTIAALADR
jgi:hypothetical protein